MEHHQSVWLVIQASQSGYGDVLGRAYEYSPHISHGRNIETDDLAVVALPAKEAKDARRVVGVGRIGGIDHPQSVRLVATFDRYLTLPQARSFEELGAILARIEPIRSTE
jgi:hypothetical protein